MSMNFRPVSMRCLWLATVVLAALALPALAEQTTGPVPKVITDIAYRTDSQPKSYEAERCKLDLYLPAGKTGFPTLVWLHGGGITAGRKDDEKQQAIGQNFARHGIALVSINYRLSPKAKFPAYVEDTAAAFAWVKKHIADHGGNPQQVFLGGHSAGAYLSYLVGLDSSFLRGTGYEPRDIAGLVPVTGQTLTHFTVRKERGIPQSQLLADAAAPLYHAHAEAPPMLILYAEKDMALRAEENELLAAALREAHAKKVEIHKIKGANHGSVGHNLALPEDEGFQYVKAFILSAGR